MSNPQFTQAQVDAFLKTVTTWAKSLPADQQAMLDQLLARAKANFSLSEDQLSGVVGGLSALLISVRRPVMESDWMQWQARQY